MGDSSVRRLEIVFDRENGTYMPGELVSGKVLAMFTRPKKIRGLRLVVVGESVVQWSAGSEKADADGHYHQEILTSREDYFSSKFYLLGSNTGPEIHLPPDQLSYPFNIQLPMNLPSSFEHEYGYVRYTIKAIFDRPWKFDHEVKTAFTVISAFDLNRRPEASLAIKETAEKSFCCFCICPRGEMDAKMSIPLSGFVPGQTIPITVECNNDSNVDIEKVKVQLKKKLNFHATMPRWSNKEVEEIVTEVKLKQPFQNDVEQVTLQLKVPPLPPSSLEYCGIIELNYVLRVVVCFDGMHCSLERFFPILIGTIPLYNSFNTYDTNVAVAPPASAPLLQQPPPSYNPYQGMPQPGVMPQPGMMPQPGVMPQPGDFPQAPGFGFVMNNVPYPNNLPPPSYEACMNGSRSIRDKGESEYVEGARMPFAPRYPVYDWSHVQPTNTVPNAPPLEKQ